MGRPSWSALVSHFDFIKRTRLMDNGLYGKTTGLANGFDNTPNQDYGSKEQTYNDLSIQQAQSAYYIAKIAHEIGDTETEERFQKEYEDLTALINEKLWSKKGSSISTWIKTSSSRTFPPRPACGRCPHTWRRRNAPTRWSGTMP